MNMSDKVDRRRFLKSSAGAIATFGALSNIVGSAVADSSVDPLILKGSRSEPLSVEKIESRRREYLREHLAGRSDTLDEVVVGTPDVTGDEYVAGYGLGFRNGVPVEFIRPVSGSESITIMDSDGGSLVDTSGTTDPVDDAHASVDEFASRLSDGSVSANSGTVGPHQEPKWRYMGVVELENTAWSTVEIWGDKQTKAAGKIDLALEVYRGPENNKGRAYWTGKLIAKQWPGTVLDNGWRVHHNLETFISQDWSAGPTRTDELDLIKHGPSTNKTSDLDFSLTVAGGTTGGQLGITASYDVPHMRRIDESQPDQSVAQKYRYPSKFWEQCSKASGQDIQVENIGEFRMFPPSKGYESLLDIKLQGAFEDPKTPNWPNERTSVSASVSPFDLA